MTRAWKAALLSALLGPGAGQIYNRDYAAGGLFAAATLAVVAYMTFVVYRAVEAAVLVTPPDLPELVAAVMAALSKEQLAMGIGHGVIFVLWGASAVHAYRAAEHRPSGPPA